MQGSEQVSKRVNGWMDAGLNGWIDGLEVE